MSTVLFTADLHLGHRRVAELRGFDSLYEHDDVILNHWETTVQDDDQVWVLGDISNGGKNQESLALDFLSDLPGRKHLITGNHDSCHPMHRRAFASQSDFLAIAFDSVQPFARRRIDGTEILLSHFPYPGIGGDRGEDRFTQWRLRDEGTVLLHGHTHMEHQVIHFSGNGTPQIHVGWDAWRRFVDINTVKAMLEADVRELLEQ